jgi:hypothetical protein
MPKRTFLSRTPNPTATVVNDNPRDHIGVVLAMSGQSEIPTGPFSISAHGTAEIWITAKDRPPIDWVIFAVDCDTVRDSGKVNASGRHYTAEFKVPLLVRQPPDSHRPFTQTEEERRVGER